MPELLTVKSGLYFDSVALMQVSTRVKQTTPGVTDALIGMGTELNLELMAGVGFTVPADVTPNDLVIALRATDDESLAAGRAGVDSAFEDLSAAARSAGGLGGGEQPPLTVESAAAHAGANLAVVSVPGAYAGIEARAALDSGASVLLFSDNVDVETEVALKRRAAATDLLVMGPDCGTAIIGGAGLGFANRVQPGSFGIVAASGTGAQQVSTLLDAAGVGVSHLIGTGGRDMSAAVGGLTTKQALRALAADPQTEHVVVVSKPADPGVVAEIRDLAAQLGVAVSWAVLGPDSPDLTQAVEAALTAAGRTVPEWPAWVPDAGDTAADGAATVAGGPLRALFCGGTLADEAMLIAQRSLGPIPSNIPLAGAPAIDGAHIPADGHVVVDFGDDAMTQGRAHPMIDPSLRLDAIREQGATAGVLLLDLVLGDGAHADPAADLAAAITDARAAAKAAGRELPVVVSLLGTPADPQGLDATVVALTTAGAEVFASNARAVRRTLELLGAGAEAAPAAHPGVAPTAPGAATQANPSAPAATADGPDSPALRGLLSAEPTVVTVGVSLFADALRDQAVAVTEVPWQPPLGDADAIFRVMSDDRRVAANQEALERILSAGAELVGLRPARECLGLADNEFLHSGPPLTWENASGPMRGALAGAVVFEGLAGTLEEAEAGLADGTFTMAPCHSRDAVGPMAGVVSPSMWMFELRDPAYGGRAYCSLNEGLGKVLRYGANNDEVLTRLRWMRDVLGPVLAEAVAAHGPIDTKYYVSQMLQSGDEGHNRNRTATLLFLRDIMPDMLALKNWDAADLAESARFLGANDYFALNLVMPTCKLAMHAAKGVAGSSMVVTMARNGTEFGVQLAGTGDMWFTGPAQIAEGLFLGSYGPDDANPDIGDSAITETAGIGGLAMAAAPAVVRLVGGDVPFAVETTQRMYEITLGEHPVHQIPILEFRGVPSGIDLVKVLRTNVLPQINTGMAGKVAGVGQVGAGLVNPPQECFTGGVQELAARV